MYPILFRFGSLTIYAYGFFLAPFFFLRWRERQKAVTRFFIEMLKGDPRGFLFQKLFSTSQVIGVGLVIPSLFMLFYLKRGQRR